MKKVIITLLSAGIFFILDISLMPFLAIKGYYPSLLLIFIICFSIINGSWDGLWLGIVAGIFQDLYFSNAFGINCLANMLICVAAAKIGNWIFREKNLVPILSSFVLSVTKGCIVYGILYVIGIYFNIKSVLYVSLYNMALTFFMYRWVYKLSKKPYMQKKWNFRKW